MLEDILRTEYGLEASDLVPLLGGRVNQLWTYGPWVVKVYNESMVPSARAQAVAILQSELAARGIPAPAPIRTRSGTPWVSSAEGTVVVMPLMPGHRRSRGALRIAEAASFGQALGQLHKELLTVQSGVTVLSAETARAVPLPEAVCGRWADTKKQAESIETPTEFDALVVKIADYAVDALGRGAMEADWSRQPWQLCHGDMHLDNVLFSQAGDVTGVVDFDNSRMGFIGNEVMMAWNLCLCRDPGTPVLGAEAATFFSSYLESSGLAAGVVEEFPALYWHSLVSNTWPAGLRYKGRPVKRDWIEILELRLRAAKWLDTNRDHMAKWLGHQYS